MYIYIRTVSFIILLFRVVLSGCSSGCHQYCFINTEHDNNVSKPFLQVLFTSNAAPFIIRIANESCQERQALDPDRRIPSG